MGWPSTADFPAVSDLPSAAGSETVRTTEDVVAGGTEVLDFVTGLFASGVGTEVPGAAVWSAD